MVLLHPGDVRIVRWIARIYDLNSIAAGGALLCFMVMFGLLTDAVGGLTARGSCWRSVMEWPNESTPPRCSLRSHRVGDPG